MLIRIHNMPTRLLRTWRWIGAWRWAILIGGPVILAALVLLAGGSLVPRDRTWERIQTDKVLRIGMEAAFPPFESWDPITNTFVGFDIDLASALSERLGEGIHPEFVNVGFDSLYDQLLAGRYDIILSALPVDPIWTEDVRYSRPYFQAGLVLVTHRDLIAELRGTTELVGRRVAIEWGSEADAFGRQLTRHHGEMTLLPFQAGELALQAVKEREADACIIDRISALQFLRGADELTIVGDPLTDVSYAIATRRTSPLLARAIDIALAELASEGFLDQLVEKWL